MSADAIKRALTLHKNQVMTYDMESTQRINVLRSDVFRDGIYAFGRATFDTTKYLKVRFSRQLIRGARDVNSFVSFYLKWVKDQACFVDGLIVCLQYLIHKL